MAPKKNVNKRQTPENERSTPAPEENPDGILKFVNSLPANHQEDVQAIIDITTLPIDRKLVYLEEHLTVAQLRRCRRLLEKECSNFKQFLSKAQLNLVDKMIQKKDFDSIRRIISGNVAALEAFQNYLKYNGYENDDAEAEEEDTKKSKKGKADAKKEAKKLKRLEAHLTVEQLEICRRLLEEERFDFKKFLPKSQHKIVDQFIVKKDFASVRDLITAADLPAALEAYENYLKYNKIEISVTSSVDEDDSETTVINDKKSADAKNTEELPEGNGEREEEEQRELNTPVQRCFPYLEGETDEIVQFVYSTIKTRNLSAKAKDQLILSCLTDENKQKYQRFRDELTTNISMAFGHRQKSIRLKKLLLGGSSPVKGKNPKWLSKLSKEEAALELAIVLMNNMLQRRLKKKADNDDNNQQLVLYNAEEVENRERKRERDNKRKLKAKRPNILKRFWRLMTTAAKLFRNYFRGLNSRHSRRRSKIRPSRGSAILYRRFGAPSVQSLKPLIEY